MPTTRRGTVAAGLLVALAVSVTGCGSDSGNSPAGAMVQGAAKGGAPGVVTPSASTAAEGNAPTFDFPPDITVAVEKTTTGDATKDAILRDVAHSAQATIEAFAKGVGQTANMNRYFAASALTYFADRVATVRKSGLTLTGDYRLYDFEVTDIANGRAAAARYCEDQRKAYSKEIKTRKVVRTRPSDKDFILFSVQAQRDSAGDWQVTQVSWKKADAACVRS
ncbi:hypothetical protein ACWDR3_24090 [Streptomyces sp. NPDC001002]